jgi:hypothetical protein
MLDFCFMVWNAYGMKPNTVNPQVKQASTGSSKTGAILSVVALILSAIGYGLIHADYKTKKPLNGAGEKAADAVASGTAHVYSSLIGVPFLCVGIVLGLIAVLLTLLRIRKVKAAGLVFSVVWILISVWAIKIAIAAFSVIKAH